MKRKNEKKYRTENQKNAKKTKITKINRKIKMGNRKNEKGKINIEIEEKKNNTKKNEKIRKNK